MALLRNRDSAEWLVLRPEHVFGRNPLRADTYLADTGASLIHASVRWREGAWYVADHSRNGTFVNGHLLAKEHWLALNVGQELRFGSTRACAWEVVELSAPSASLVAVDPTQPPILLVRNNLLPNDTTAELAIFQAEHGQWMLDREDEVRALRPGETLLVAGCSYRFVVSAEIEDTAGQAGTPEQAPLLRFCLSDNEEHAHLTVHRGGEVIDLGERIHHYCLVTMARQRLRDAKRDLPRGSQGWLFTNELAKLLRIDVMHLNLQIFRARNQLIEALPNAAPTSNIVERRRGSLRLGDIAFEIVRGDATEGRYDPVLPRGISSDKPQ